MALRNVADVRLIAIDMDGTLLGETGGVSERNLAALREAERAGIEIVIATGRRHCYAMRVLRELDLHPAASVVSSNGTVVRTVGAELVLREHFPLETVRRLCAHLAPFRNTLVLTFDNVDAEGNDRQGALVCEHLDELHASIGRWMESNRDSILHVERLEHALEAEPPIQMMLCGTVERMAAAEALLLQDPTVTAVGEEEGPETEITLHRTIYPERDLAIVDILPAGCSKATALEHMAAARGLQTNQLMAIGDNWNDVPMLRLAGHPVVMANAPADLLALAAAGGWTVAPSNAEDGVAVVVERVVAERAATKGEVAERRDTLLSVSA